MNYILTLYALFSLIPSSWHIAKKNSLGVAFSWTFFNILYWTYFKWNKMMNEIWNMKEEWSIIFASPCPSHFFLLFGGSPLLSVIKSLHTSAPASVVTFTEQFWKKTQTGTWLGLRLETIYHSSFLWFHKTMLNYWLKRPGLWSRRTIKIKQFLHNQTSKSYTERILVSNECTSLLCL